jgi:hypothetical protein
MEEPFGIHGIITLHKIPPEWSPEDFAYWWNPVTAPNGQVLQPARISDDAKRLWLAHEPIENILTNTAISLLLTNMSVANQSQMFPFTQILSAGNGAIVGVMRKDAAVAGDGFATGARKAPSSFAVTGFSTTVTTQYGTSDAVGTFTNIGFYGYSVAGSQNASVTSGTGALMTHALFSFVKAAGSAYAVNYNFSMSN